jgi:hypothetical protein
MICSWRSFTWTVPDLRLPRRRSTPTLHPRRPSHRLARLMAATAAPVATGPKYHNKNRNSGNGGGHNGKNSTGGEGHGGSSSQTTTPTSSDGRTNASWSTYSHPWQGHMTMYPGLVPAGRQHPQAFVATPCLYASPGPCPGRSSSSSRCTSKPPRA